eukprot:gene22478-biopygen2737
MEPPPPLLSPAGHFVVWVARAWRGHGAGVARACPVTPGVTGQWRGRGAGMARAWR